MTHIQFMSLEIMLYNTTQKIRHGKFNIKNITHKIQQENMQQGNIQHRKI